MRATTSSSGVGIGTGGVGYGIASSSTSGVQQSALSQQAAPPVRHTLSEKEVVRNLVIMVVCGLFGVALLVSGLMDFEAKPILIGLGLLLVPVGGIWQFKQAQEDAKAYEKSLAEWQRTKMCNRCGHFYG